MTESEKSVLRKIQEEGFRLRVELDHERKCIDEAVSILKNRTIEYLAREKTAIPQAVAIIIDDAIKALQEPVPK